MTISLFQAFLMGIIYYLGNIGTPWTTVLGSASIFQKPLVAGTLVGLILGHPIEGVIIGAAIQLPYIAYISAGGTIPSDPGLAGSSRNGLCDCGRYGSGDCDYHCGSVRTSGNGHLDSAYDGGCNLCAPGR